MWPIEAIWYGKIQDRKTTKDRKEKGRVLEKKEG